MSKTVSALLWLASVLVAGFLGYFVKWLNCPWGRHICFSPDMLSPDYTQYWYMFGGIFGILAMALLACLIFIATILYKFWKRYQSSWRSL